MSAVVYWVEVLGQSLEKLQAIVVEVEMLFILREEEEEEVNLQKRMEKREKEEK